MGDMAGSGARRKLSRTGRRGKSERREESGKIEEMEKRAELGERTEKWFFLILMLVQSIGVADAASL